MDVELQGLERRWRETGAPEDRARLATALERAGREPEAEQHFLDIYRQDPHEPTARAFLLRNLKYTTGYIAVDPISRRLIVIEPGREPFSVDSGRPGRLDIAVAGGKLHIRYVAMGPTERDLQFHITISERGISAPVSLEGNVLCMMPIAGTDDVGFVRWVEGHAVLQRGSEEVYAHAASPNLAPFADLADRVLYCHRPDPYDTVMSLHEQKRGETETRAICCHDGAYIPSVVILEGSPYISGPIDGSSAIPEHGFFREQDVDRRPLPLDSRIAARRYPALDLWLPETLSLFHPEQERIVIDSSKLFQGLCGEEGPFHAKILEAPRTLTRAMYQLHLEQKAATPTLNP